MTNTELIRQEIERRLLEDYNSGDTEIDEVAQGVCAALLHFIDSLPKETVTNCHQLDEEIESEWAKCNPIDEGMGLESANIVNEQFDDIARHFAKWGAEHLIDGNKVIGDHIADEGKRVSGDSIKSKDLKEAAEEYAKDETMSGLAERAFKAGANWRREQDHDACYQCEKAYDNVFYRGEKHAIKMLKEEGIGGTVCGRVIDHINIRFADGVGKYLEPKDISHIPADKSKYNIGDKVKVIILKDGNED